MKPLILVLLFVLIGCTSEKEEPCKTNLEKCQMVTSSNLQYFHNACEKLAKCMKKEWTITYYPKQTHNPYACTLSYTGKTGRKKGRNLYPRGEVSFDRVYSAHLDEAIITCEMMTETGEQSDEYYAELDRAFAEMDKKRQDALTPKHPKSPAMKIQVSE